MEKEISWTIEAERSYAQIIEFLQKNWTDREIENLINATEFILTHIAKNPKMFRKARKANTHEVLITYHNLLIYKVYSTHLLLFWDTRQNPKQKKY
ncbi:MAG TPA: hypothetical protein VEC12_02795 [Bacteroidia bacterium]|nr:hypothetical protein [Bacteroidia bacterium]